MCWLWLVRRIPPGLEDNSLSPPLRRSAVDHSHSQIESWYVQQVRGQHPLTMDSPSPSPYHSLSSAADVHVGVVKTKMIDGQGWIEGRSVRRVVGW